MGTDKPPVLLKTQSALSKVSRILANTTGDWIGWGKTPYNSLPAFLSRDIVYHPESLEFYASIHPKVRRGTPTLDDTQEGRDVLESPEALPNTHNMAVLHS